VSLVRRADGQEERGGTNLLDALRQTLRAQVEARETAERSSAGAPMQETDSPIVECWIPRWEGEVSIAILPSSEATGIAVCR
jgi:hypothetical protein